MIVWHDTSPAIPQTPPGPPPWHAQNPPQSPPVPVRVQILHEGAQITAGDRNKSYGDPIDNLGLAGRLKREFWANVTRQIGPAEQEAIELVITKLARLARGEVRRDTYMDGAVYFAIAGEVAEMEQET